MLQKCKHSASTVNGSGLKFNPIAPIDLERDAVEDARPAKDFESCETVSIAESARCSLVQCPAQPVNHEWTPMNTNHQMICLRLGSACVSHAGCGVPDATNFVKQRSRLLLERAY